MTCIVATLDRTNNSVVMAADSIGIDSGLNYRVVTQSKLIRLGDFLIGFAGSFRVGDILRYCLKMPPIEYGDYIEKYLVTKFVPALQSALENANALSKDEDGHTVHPFLLAYKDRLFKIDGDFHIQENANGFESIGVACEIAIGAMAALDKRKMTAEKKVLTALEIACKFSAGVTKPFNLMST